MKKIIVIIAISLVVFTKSECIAQAEKDTLRVLFVGNSYTYDDNLAQIISIISDDLNTKLITKKSVSGGFRLRQHWLGERGVKSKELIKNGDFDIVVLQGHSLSTINEPDSLLKYSKLFCDLIKESGAKPYFYSTWARKMVPQHQEIINDGYKKAANENNAVIVPVGKAWELAKKLRPTIELYDPDGSHPSQMGTFLTACVFTKKLTGELPEKLQRSYMIKDIEGETVNLMHIDPFDAIFCKKIADEAVK